MAVVELRVVGAQGLRHSYFHKPSAYAIVTVNECQQKKTTPTVCKSASPVWKSKFSLNLTPESVVDIVIVDERRQNDRERCQLGSASIKVSDALGLTTDERINMDLNLGSGSGTVSLAFIYSTAGRTEVGPMVKKFRESSADLYRRISSEADTNDVGASTDTYGLLEYPWKKYTDKHGRTVYVNHDVGLAQYFRPVTPCASFDSEVVDETTMVDFKICGAAKVAPKPLGIISTQEFCNKLVEFRARISIGSEGGNRVVVKVTEGSVLEDSFAQLAVLEVEKLKGPLEVRCSGGGSIRDYFHHLSTSFTDPSLCLFIPSVNDDRKMQINPNSGVNPAHLHYFRFLGTMVGLAIVHGFHFGGKFVQSFFRHILGLPMELIDISAIDSEVYQSLRWLLENDISGANLALNFVVDDEYIGETIQKELVSGGARRKVIEENKHEYISLMAKWWVYERVEPQISSFCRGLFAIIPRASLVPFESEELEWVVCGDQIDIRYWRANTSYHGYSENSPVVQWFWQVVEDMEDGDLNNLFRAVTGAKFNGFVIAKAIDGDLPAVHTLERKLVLPDYVTRSQVKEGVSMILKYMV